MKIIIDMMECDIVIIWGDRLLIHLIKDGVTVDRFCPEDDEILSRLFSKEIKDYIRSKKIDSIIDG
jgi:hypothetical protein